MRKLGPLQLVITFVLAPPIKLTGYVELRQVKRFPVLGRYFEHRADG
jgi:hypothetical protein